MTCDVNGETPLQRPRPRGLRPLLFVHCQCGEDDDEDDNEDIDHCCRYDGHEAILFMSIVSKN